jgi:pimeloyl-ACP methyl ester carboxylesterase/DNA-binding SARP family transcriptional activator
LAVVGERGSLGPRDLGGRKPKQVFELLVVHRGEAVPKERLVDMLWPGTAPRHPIRTLEAYVSTARSALSHAVDDARAVLRTELGAYRVPAEALRLDLDDFDEGVTEAYRLPIGQRRALRRRLLRLWRGDLLADEPYAEWADPLRALYAERHLALQLDLAEDYLAGEGVGGADYAEAVALTQTVLATHPTRERAHRLLITAHYAAGDQDQALISYHRCRQVLSEELGVDPLPETQRVFRAVLSQERLPAIRQAPVTVRLRPPVVQYARRPDATIAYQDLAEAQNAAGPTLVFAHAWFSHMEVGWEEPRYSSFLRRLAQGRRLLIFDRRGMGMSDPAPPSVTLEQRADDITAVMDAAGVRQAVLIGSCGSGPTAISVASRHPERVAGLVLFGTFARMLAAPDYPAGWSAEFFSQYKDGIEQGWSTGRGVYRSVPSAGDDEALMEWLGRLLRLSANPVAARAILDFGATLDVRSQLTRIDAPTLVLHRRHDQWVDPDNGRYLADHIPGARFELLDGADHWPWFGDADAVLDAIDRFLDDHVHVPVD